MGTNNLSKSGIVLGQDAEPEQLTQVIDALVGDLVGRQANGSPTTKGNGASLGLTTIPFKNLFADQVVMQEENLFDFLWGMSIARNYITGNFSGASNSQVSFKIDTGSSEFKKVRMELLQTTDTAQASKDEADRIRHYFLGDDAQDRPRKIWFEYTDGTTPRRFLASIDQASITANSLYIEFNLNKELKNPAGNNIAFTDDERITFYLDKDFVADSGQSLEGLSSIQKFIAALRNTKTLLPETAEFQVQGSNRGVSVSSTVEIPSEMSGDTRITANLWKDVLGDDNFVVQNSVTFELADFLGLAIPTNSERTTTGVPAAKAVTWANFDASETFSLFKADADSFGFASSAAGGFKIELEVDRINVTKAIELSARGNVRLTQEDDGLAATVNNIPDNHIDTLVMGNMAAPALDQGEILIEGLAINFTYQGFAYRLVKVYTEPGTFLIQILFPTVNQAAAIAAINDLRVDVTNNAGDKQEFKFGNTWYRTELFQNQIEFEWNNVPAAPPVLTPSASNTIEFLSPAQAKNYLPTAVNPGDNGKLLVAENGKGSWKDNLTTLLKDMPSYGPGDANKFVALNAAGNGYTYRAGSTGVQSVPSGDTFPTNPPPGNGDRFDLLTAQSGVAFDPVGEMVQVRDSGNEFRALAIEIGGSHSGGPHRIIAYDTNWVGPTRSIENEVRGKVFLQYNSSTPDADKMPATVYLYRLGQASDTKTVGAKETISGIRDHFLINGLSYSDLSTGQYHRNLEYTGNNGKVYSDEDKAVGAYVYSNTLGWQFSVDTPAVWARQGQPAPRTLLAVDEIMEGSGNGLTLNANQMAVSTGLVSFNPVVDLDAAEYGHGIFEVQVSLVTGDPTVPNQIGFEADSGTDNNSRRGEIGGFVFASRLRETAVADASGNPPHYGILIGTIQVYDGLSATSTIAVYLGRNAQNQIGYIIARLAGGAAERAAITLASRVSVAFVHNDTPDVSNLLTGLTVQNSNTLLGAALTVKELNFGTGLTAIRTADKVTVSGGQATYYTALSQLPTTGLTIGQTAFVRIGTAAVMQFMAVSTTQWLCVSGSSGYLFDGNVSVVVTSINQMNPVNIGNFVWDARFPYHLIKINYPGRRVGKHGGWHRVKTSDLLALTETSGNVLLSALATDDSSYIGLANYEHEISTGNTFGTSGFVAILGKGTNNAARIALSDGVVRAARNNGVQIIGSA